MSALDAEIARLDAEDPLRHFRDEFEIRDGLVYLDGNSLGMLPKRTLARMNRTVTEEWGQGLITSWLGADWVNSPRRIGDKIGKLLGAKPGEVIAGESTSINIFKALTAALSLQKGRNVLLSETTNFPTDNYMMQGLARFSGGALECREVAPDDVLDALDESVAVLLLTQVHYKTARIRDMAEVTQRAHEAGALVVWDLSHSAGAIEVDLTGANADFAVGCGYKFLNGGPGAPAYFFAAERHHQSVREGLAHNEADKALLLRNRIKKHSGKSRIYDVSYLTDTTGIKYRRILLPVWILHYRYNDTPMKVVTCGLHGRTFGERPFSTSKLLALAALVASAMTAFGFAWGALGLY